MRCGVIAAVLLCLVLSIGGAAFGQADFVYFSTDLGTIPYHRALAVLALQGIVNRDAPRLYVNTRSLHGWYASNPRENGNEWDETWLSIYAGRGYVYETVTELSALLGHAAFRPTIAGLVLYDPTQLNSSTWIAMTIAGIEDRLPVTPNLMAAIPELSSWWPDQLDLRPLLGDKFASYQWAVDDYLASAGQEVAYTAAHDLPFGDPGDIMGLDYGVAKRAFVFDLSLHAGNHPDQEALADTIVRNVTPLGALMGWNGEVDFASYASTRGVLAVNACGLSNLSFHRQMPPVSGDPLQQTSRLLPDDLSLDPNTYYVAVVYPDGNALNRLTRFCSGAWFEPERGQVPMNWSVNTGFVEEFPALFEYFYANATDHDYFVAGKSGAGDTRPSLMPNWDDYAASVAASNAIADITIALVQDYDLSAEIYDPFLAIAGLEGVGSLQSTELFFRGDHVPFIPVRLGGWGEPESGVTTSDIAGGIHAAMSETPPPAFGVVHDRWASRPSVAREVMGILAPLGYEFLRLDEMNALVRQIDHFYDVGVKYWAHDEVEACFDSGIVSGYSESHYRPTLPVTRDQMAVYIARALAGGEESVPEFTGTPTFADVPEGSWALKHVEYAVFQNVVAGYQDGSYHPEYQVTRDQMAVYVARSICDPTGEDGLAGYTPADPRNFPDAPSSFWSYKHIEYCVEQGVVQGYEDGLYHPEVVVTRDQMAVYVARAFGLTS